MDIFLYLQQELDDEFDIEVSPLIEKAIMLHGSVSDKRKVRIMQLWREMSSDTLSLAGQKYARIRTIINDEFCENQITTNGTVRKIVEKVKKWKEK